MRTLAKTILFILTGTLAASCTVIQPLPGNKPVRLIFYNEINLVIDKTRECKYLGPLVSSEGHWYSYLFISNTDLTAGAINDMYNKANKIGANIVYINSNIDFTTSVTLLGQAYDCRIDGIK
jgi:hypothetical protein